MFKTLQYLTCPDQILHATMGKVQGGGLFPEKSLYLPKGFNFRILNYKWIYYEIARGKLALHLAEKPLLLTIIQFAYGGARFDFEQSSTAENVFQVFIFYSSWHGDKKQPG